MVELSAERFDLRRRPLPSEAERRILPLPEDAAVSVLKSWWRGMNDERL